jgi:addiction module HigA family antidote
MTKTPEIFAAPPDGFAMAPARPGEGPQEEIAARGLAALALGLKLRAPANRPAEIVDGKRGISPDAALRLSRRPGPGAAFWLNSQSQYAWRWPRSGWGRRSGRRSRRREDRGLVGCRGEAWNEAGRFAKLRR